MYTGCGVNIAGIRMLHWNSLDVTAHMLRKFGIVSKEIPRLRIEIYQIIIF